MNQTLNFHIPKNLKDKLDTKRLIFTITTGRSGTGYLANLLALFPKTLALHEPHPRFSNAMRASQTNPNVAYQFWIEQKLPCIANEQAPIYIETSHLFCKGFVEPLFDLGVLPDLIILTRPHRDVAKSFYQLGVIPGRSEDSLRWLLSPEDSGVLHLTDWQHLHDYQLCYWYCLEIERREQFYARKFQENGARIAKISLEETKSVRKFYRFAKRLDLPPLNFRGWINYFQRRIRKTNRKSGYKKKIGVASLLESTIISLEQELLNRIPTTTNKF